MSDQVSKPEAASDKLNIVETASADNPISFASVIGDRDDLMVSTKYDVGEDFGEVTLVQDGIQRGEADKGLNSIVGDILTGPDDPKFKEGFSPDSKEFFKTVFDLVSKQPNANADTVFQFMNGIGASINEGSRARIQQEQQLDPRRRTDPIGMVKVQEGNSTHFYMMLSRTNEELQQNRLSAITGALQGKSGETNTFIKVGTFTPGEKI